MIVPLTAACLAAATLHSDLPIDVLRALQQTEGGRVGEVALNRDPSGRVTSRDIGIFGINDVVWLGHFTAQWHLASRQTTFDLLRDNGCANAFAAAEVFKHYLDEAGGNFGVAVGYYNSHTPAKADIYRRHFLAALLRLRSRERSLG